MLVVEDLVFAYDGGPALAAAPAAERGEGPSDAQTGEASSQTHTVDEPSPSDDRPPTADRVLDGVSLTVPDGEVLLLAGPNGSGKSTLVRHFVGLAEPDAGRVRVDGVDPVTEPVAARTAVGMVFQRPRDQLVAATVGADVAFGPENLGLDRAEIDRRVTEALDTVGMTGRRDERVAALSGGEQARVALAGVLAMEPSHLVLDEPFVGLDAPARDSVLSHVRTLAATDTTVIIVTHDLRELLPLTDRVVVLSDGEVALRASPETARERLPALGVRVPES
ncbi:energy-coupling factor ABC transporter ATP-binding protein [Halobaculum sp. MBLA0147]|uniref:energy-coupling factor ABC transporter ATP-binding protein n=1 Tax=Halobaculum sp. MBLA0147 TaxID=3079934 RepID=UPI003524E530